MSEAVHRDKGYEAAAQVGSEFQNREMRGILDRLANWTRQNSGEDNEFMAGYNSARAFVQSLMSEYQAKPLGAEAE